MLNLNFLLPSLSFADKIAVFNQETANQLVTFFDQQNKEEDYLPEETIQRWELKKDQPAGMDEVDPHDSWFEIKFDDQGKVISGELSQQYRYAKDYAILQEATKVAAEAMAKQLGWKNETHWMGMSLMQSQMVSGKEYSLHFHQDLSRHTMVVLLNDEKKWEGGHLKFRSFFCPVIQQTYLPQQGYGVLFSNEGKQHAVTPMTNHSNKIVERTILTIHERPKDYELDNHLSTYLKGWMLPLLKKIQLIVFSMLFIKKSFFSIKLYKDFYLFQSSLSN
jgi:hypothetical protein